MQCVPVYTIYIYLSLSNGIALSDAYNVKNWQVQSQTWPLNGEEAAPFLYNCSLPEAASQQSPLFCVSAFSNASSVQKALSYPLRDRQSHS